MAEQEQVPSTEQAPSTENEQTLDQVYEKYNVEEAASEFHPQRQEQRVEQQQTTQQPPLGAEIPDPVLDQAGFKAHLAKQSLEVRQALAQSTQFQQQLWQQELNRRQEADIKSAVHTIQEKIGNDIDEDVVESLLGAKARKDAKFLSIYNNRGKNPNAWKAALGAVANEFKGKYTFRQDSQLTENVRAAKQSTQSSLTAKESASDNPIERKLNEAKTPAEFERYWNTIKSEGM